MNKTVNAGVVELRVKGSTPPKSLAGSIYKSFMDEKAKEVKITAVGASSVNQATKGIAIATSYVANNAKRLNTAIGFVNVEISGEVKSAMLWRLELE